MQVNKKLKGSFLRNNLKNFLLKVATIKLKKLPDCFLIMIIKNFYGVSIIIKNFIFILFISKRKTHKFY